MRIVSRLECQPDQSWRPPVVGWRHTIEADRTSKSIGRAAGREVDKVSSVDVSVVLPIFNEREHLLQELDRVEAALLSSDYTFELIVVDDGSVDGGSELLAGRDVRLIRFDQNRGSGSARRAGTLASRGDVVVWTDVDMTYPNDQIPELVDALDGYDHVVGARTSERGTLKVLRVPAKYLIRRLAAYLVETDIPDLNSGFRAFRRDVALQYVHLLPTGFSCVTTMTMAFLGNGYSVRYIEIPYEKRAGSSKFHWWADTKRYLTQVVRMTLSYNPLRVFLPIGLFLVMAGFIKLGWDWSQRDFQLAANTLLVFFIGLNVISIGLLADLVVRATSGAGTRAVSANVRVSEPGERLEMSAADGGT
jgi:polyisoprenyl-phosphate glycosyltransferase